MRGLSFLIARVRSDFESQLALSTVHAHISKKGVRKKDKVVVDFKSLAVDFNNKARDIIASDTAQTRTVTLKHSNHLKSFFNQF